MKDKKNEIVAAAEAGEVVTNCDHLMRRILTVRGRSVMVDRDLAALYKVPTKRLNEQVKRNSERFPERFMFRLSAEEMKELVANCDRFAAMKHSSVAMYAFTEQGVAMLATVLKSEVAVRASIDIMDAFVATTPSCTTWVRQSTALGGASRPTRPATRRKSPRFWRRFDERRGLSLLAKTGNWERQDEMKEMVREFHLFAGIGGGTCGGELLGHECRAEIGSRRQKSRTEI